MSDAMHERFKKNLKKSEEAVWQVARWLSGKGHNVKINAPKIAPEREDWQAYSDAGDLEICLRVEVKALTAKFTCREDWPFPDFIVCSQHSYDRATPKPYRYFYLNAAKTHCAMLDVVPTRKEWTVRNIKDGSYDDVGELYNDFYVCDPMLATFHRIGE